MTINNDLKKKEKRKKKTQLDNTLERKDCSGALLDLRTKYNIY